MKEPRHRRALLTACLLVACAFSSPEDAGMKVRRGATVLFGSPSNCSQPASVVLQKIQRRTPEWRTIQRENIRTGTGRYDLLVAKMNVRIKHAAKAAASDLGRDCVVRESDILDARGMVVVDLTKDVMKRLRTVSGEPLRTR